MAPMIRRAIWTVKLLTYLTEKFNFFFRMKFTNFSMNLISSTISISCCQVNLHSTSHSLLLLIIDLLYYISSHILKLYIGFLVFFANYTVNILKPFILSKTFWMFLLAAFANKMLTWHYNWVISLNVNWVFTTWTLYLFYRFKCFDGSLQRSLRSHCLNWCLWWSF